MKRSWQDDEDIEYQVASSAFTSVTDSIIDTHSAIKVLAITVTAEIVAFAMFYFSKDKVLDFLAESGNNVWIYGSIGVFLIGFLTVFAAVQLVAGKFPGRVTKYTVWIVSIAAGLANIALFYVLINFQMR
ncbi:MAG TPA: hypothetical protein VGQ55_03135 [Pyrinomonadaceae bacterium]|nr:hypothetical protein [Pyrinomonadaceae bacterium]